MVFQWLPADDVVSVTVSAALATARSGDGGPADHAGVGPMDPKATTAGRGQWIGKISMNRTQKHNIDTHYIYI